MVEEIKCECGFIVRGNSQKHVEANLEIHKKSKLHKRLSSSVSEPNHKQKPNISKSKARKNDKE